MHAAKLRAPAPYKPRPHDASIGQYVHVPEFSVALCPGLPMFFNIHEKNWEGLVDVMDVVCGDAHWNE